MVEYREWVSILFETYPDAEQTAVFRRAGETWSQNKQLLEDASRAEAKELAKSA